MKTVNFFALALVSLLSLGCSKFNQSDFESFLKVNEDKYVRYGESSPAPDFNGVYSEAEYFKIEKGELVKYTILDISKPEKKVNAYRIEDVRLFMNFVNGHIETNLFNNSESLTIDNMSDKSISLEDGKYKIDAVTSSGQISLLDKAVPVSLEEYSKLLKELSGSLQ